MQFIKVRQKTLNSTFRQRYSNMGRRRRLFVFLSLRDKIGFCIFSFLFPLLCCRKIDVQFCFPKRQTDSLAVCLCHQKKEKTKRHLILLSSKPNQKLAKAILILSSYLKLLHFMGDIILSKASFEHTKTKSRYLLVWLSGRAHTCVTANAKSNISFSSSYSNQLYCICHYQNCTESCIKTDQNCYILLRNSLFLPISTNLPKME